MRARSDSGERRRRVLLASACLALLAAALTCRAPTGSGAGLRWWKGNMHAHTLWSDGDSAPESVSAWYRARDYQFLVLSDHDVVLSGEKWIPVAEQPEGAISAARLRTLQDAFGEDRVELRTREGLGEMRLATLDELRPRFEEPGEFLFIPGEEVTVRAPQNVHVNGLNLRELIPPATAATSRETMLLNVEAVLAQGRELARPVLAAVNHPNYRWALGAEDLAALSGVAFFEVYNGHPQVQNKGDATHAGTEELWDRALAKRIARGETGMLYGIASDDSHHFHTFGEGRSNPGRGWVMVRAAELEAGALLDALRRGDFYSTSGVRLRELACDGRTYALAIDAEAGVEYATRFVGTRRGSERIGEVLLETRSREPRYVFDGGELCVRAVVTSSRPHPNPSAPGEREQAWLQPCRPRQ